LFKADPSDIARYLWNDIVSLVCDCLAQLTVPQKSRIWWCPTSELFPLPLHAAGLYEPRKKNFNLPDIYTSSYIPTSSALISARSDLIDQSPSIVPKLLVIGQSNKSPYHIQEEIDRIRQLGDCVNAIVGSDANRDTVLEGLHQHSWACFTSHRGANSQPFHASFELHDDSHLTLLDLIKARPPIAELAFLSACHTAAGDLSTPDEAIHLAAALQFCGLRTVVGNLCEMRMDQLFQGNVPQFRESQTIGIQWRRSLSLASRKIKRKCVPLDGWIILVLDLSTMETFSHHRLPLVNIFYAARKFSDFISFLELVWLRLPELK
jgi:hypothetical protein